MTKHRRLDGLNNRNVFPHSFGGRESKLQASAALVSPEAAPWLADGHLHIVSSRGLLLCVHIPDVSASSYEDTGSVGFGP